MREDQGYPCRECPTPRYYLCLVSCRRYQEYEKQRAKASGEGIFPRQVTRSKLDYILSRFRHSPEAPAR